MNRFRTSRALRVIAALAAMALLASCGNWSRARGAAPTSTVEPTVRYKGGSLPPLTRYDNNKRGTGRYAMRVLDDGNRPIYGATVRFSGPQRKQAVTDAQGIARVALKPGMYEVGLEPCGQRVVMLDQREADVIVVAGTERSGQLVGARWERRFRPSPSVRYSDSPPWKIGQNIDVGVRVEDRCTYREAPNAALEAYAWSASDHFGFVSTPVMRADSQGYARAVIRCREPGNGSLRIYSRTDADDYVDVLASGTGVPSDRRFCER